MSRGKYRLQPKVFAVSAVFQHGKTQVPKEVRKSLGLQDGDRILWFNEKGTFFIKAMEFEGKVSE